MAAKGRTSELAACEPKVSDRDRVRNVRLLEPVDLVRAQRQLLGGERVLQVRDLRRPGDRRRHARLVPEPRERDLRRRHAARRSDLGGPVDDGEIDLRRVEALAELVRLGTCRQLLALARPVAGEQSARKRAPGQQSDALVEALRDHLPLFLAIDEVVVVLHRDERRLRHRLGLRELPGVHAARADVARLA